MKDFTADCLREIKSSGLPVVIFGTGSRGKACKSFLDAHSIDVAAFCESESYYTPGKEIAGKIVYRDDAVPMAAEKYNLLIAATGVNYKVILPPPRKKEYLCV